MFQLRDIQFRIQNYAYCKQQTQAVRYKSIWIWLIGKWRGQKENWEEEEISFRSAQTLDFSPRGWLSPSSALCWTQYMISIFSERKKKIHPWGKNLSIYFPSQPQSEVILCMYSTLYLPANKTEAGKKMVHVNQLDNSFSLCPITLRPARWEEHWLILSCPPHAHQVNPFLSHVNESMVLPNAVGESSLNPHRSLVILQE